MPHFAWSNIYLGGKAKVVRDPSGRERKVIESRDIIEFGAKVVKGQIGDDWDQFLAEGVIRNYAPPKDIPDELSPSQHVVNEMLRGNMQLDQNQMMELALNPGVASVAAENQKDNEAPVGA